MITIGSGALTAEISEAGAELQTLRAATGADYLWDGDPAFWKGRAPLLFPMVGKAVNDHIRVNGYSFQMPQHGLARINRFEITRTSPDACTLAFAASAATQVHYPFLFRLEVTYRIAGSELAVVAVVFNEGTAAMPASFGFHPAFRWPLPGTSQRGGHEIIFEHAEPESIRRLANGLLSPERIPTPVTGRRLALDDDLFRHDALVWDRLVSRSVSYCGPGQARIRITFPDMPFLGVWSKPGAGFVCIEPWHGLASPADFDGEFSERPGVLTIPPKECRTFSMSISVAP